MKKHTSYPLSSLRCSRNTSKPRSPGNWTQSEPLVSTPCTDSGIYRTEARVGVKARHGACDRAACGRRMRVGTAAIAVREYDPGEPPLPTAVKSEHGGGDLGIQRQLAVGAAEPARRSAAPRRPLPEPARRTRPAVFVERSGVKERTVHQQGARIRHYPQVRQPDSAQERA